MSVNVKDDKTAYNDKPWHSRPRSLLVQVLLLSYIRHRSNFYHICEIDSKSTAECSWVGHHKDVRMKPQFCAFAVFYPLHWKHFLSGTKSWYHSFVAQVETHSEWAHFIFRVCPYLPLGSGVLLLRLTVCASESLLLKPLTTGGSVVQMLTGWWQNTKRK